ncbi:MAG: hypothetical protein KJZ93_11380 [Caldilineaceae bacterium]|nr:hypothetical protein [Caldilineaceae bacterium]
MVRVIHFFNLKPGADEAQMLLLVNQGLRDLARPYGCLERKTWKLLDASAQGEPAHAATYLNEALWPNQQAADAFAHATQNEEAKAFVAELQSGIETVLTVRYVDEAG